MNALREQIGVLEIGTDTTSGRQQLADARAGAVVAGSLVIMADGVSEQHVTDVLQSLLLAQLAANAKAERHREPAPWYQTYQQTLEKIGWVVETSTTMAKYQPPGTRFSPDMVINELFRQRVLPEERSLITDELNALKQDTGTRAARLFECASHAGGIGNFQVALVSEEDGIVSLRIGRFSFISTTHVIHLLQEELPQEAQYRAGFTAMNLNDQVYGSLRSAIANKLGDRVSESVAAIEPPVP